MLSSLTTSTPSLITAGASNGPRRSVTFREGKEVAKVFELTDDRCSTSETVDEDESDVCCMEENSDFYYQKEKWNPNNNNNPLKRNDYFEDDASLQLDDIFPDASSTQCQHSSSEFAFPRLDLMHATRNLNCFFSDEELDDEVTLSESLSFIYVSQEDMEADTTDEQRKQSYEHEHKKMKELPTQELSFTTVENTSFQSLSESQAF
jgi:hypothetical protein